MYKKLVNLILSQMCKNKSQRHKQEPKMKKKILYYPKERQILKHTPLKQTKENFII